MLNKLFINYYNYVNVFDRSQANISSLYRFYNYKLKFAKRADKNILFKNRIYSILNYKLEQIKKYLNEHLKKKLSYSIMLYSFHSFYLLKSQMRDCDFM